MALIDQTEEGAEGLVDMGSRPRALRLGHIESELAQPIQTVALVVLADADGQDTHLRSGFGIQQEQDSI